MTSESDSVTLAADDAPPREDEQPVGRGTQIGRYVVLGRIGSGGMGVVHAAYDPDLDRKVALKLLRSLPSGSRSGDARTRLLREAQALAKLSHPNVVAVYDVGTVGEQVWIAMEFVDGPTLAGWARERQRSWVEIMDVMLPAARGLATAHAAGILHRDLKPDNIMIGSDGRARVTDFGLARMRDAHDEPSTFDPDAKEQPSMLAQQMTQAGAVLGTPAYMSPEQLLGKPVDAKSDQFSLCVTMWELLYGDRPFSGDTLVERTSAALVGDLRAASSDRRVPSWLRRVCERGLSAEPVRRFESVEALIAALERGRARARRRPIVLGVGAVLVLGLGVVGQRRWAEARQVAACEVAGASIDEVWNDETRARLRDELLATEVVYASQTAEQATRRLDEHAASWREHSTAACLEADVSGQLDAALYERMTWCLNERRLELASVVAQLESPDVRMVQRTVGAVMALPAISQCRDATVITSLPAPPTGADRDAALEIRAQLAEVDALLWTGKPRAALEPAQTARERAQALGWPPLVAAAQLSEANVLAYSGRYPEAEAVTLEAYRQATSAEAWGTAASAAEKLTTTIGYHQARPVEGRVWSLNAEIAAGLAGDPLGLREAKRASNLGIVEYMAGDYEQALVWFERALELDEARLGPEHFGLAPSLTNLANVHFARGEYDQAIALNERALAIEEQVIGAEHPDVASALANLAVLYLMIGRIDESRALHQRALASRKAAWGPVHPVVGNSLANLGMLELTSGNLEAAERLLDEAVAVLEQSVGPEHVELAFAIDTRALVDMQREETERARPRLERALAMREKLLGPDHADVARSLNHLGRLHVMTADHERALALLERALVIRERALEPTHVDIGETLYLLGESHLALDDASAAVPRLERAIAIFDAEPQTPGDSPWLARFALARALVASKGNRARAMELAEKAREGLVSPTNAERHAEIDTWLAQQRPAGE